MRKKERGIERRERGQAGAKEKDKEGRRWEAGFGS